MLALLLIACALSPLSGQTEAGIGFTRSEFPKGDLILHDCGLNVPWKPASVAKPDPDTGALPPSQSNRPPPAKRSSSAPPASAPPTSAPPTVPSPSAGLPSSIDGNSVNGLIGGLGTRGGGLGGGGTAEGLGGLGTKGAGSGASGYGSGIGSMGTAPTPVAPSEAPAPTKMGEASKETEPDWGAEIFLSNDDSMSLASAQRLLWAADRGMRIESSQVRPHEFLNYFHFPTAAVAAGDSFSVQTSALADEEGKMTLAFSVAGATMARQPLDLTFVLDRSGSMSAEGRMSYIQRGLQLVEKQLQKGDRVDIVLFDSDVCTPMQNYVVGRDDPSQLPALINALRPRSSTNLGIGLQEGYRIVSERNEQKSRAKRVILITDALVNEGQLDTDVLTQIGAAYEESGVRLTGVGVGREFSDKVLDKLTEKGHGPYLYLGSEAVVDRFFGDGFLSMTHTLAHDVRFSVDLPDSLAQEKFYGEESSTNEADIQPINYQSGNTQLFLQDLFSRNPKPDDPISFRIRWKDPATEAEKEQVIHTTVGAALEQSPVAIRKARALLAWGDMAFARAANAEACKAPYERFQQRMALAASDDPEMTYLNDLTAKLCPSGRWATIQQAYTGGSSRVMGTFSLGNPQIKGSLNPDATAMMLKRFGSQFRYCYQRELTRNPAIAGKITVRFVVARSGEVSNAIIASSTLQNPSVESCVVGRFSRMLFPTTGQEDAVSLVTVDMTFAP